MTQADLAATLDPSMTHQKIAMIESGARKVTIGEAVAICAALDVPLDEMVLEGWVPEPTLREALRLVRMNPKFLSEIELRQIPKAEAVLADQGD